MITRKDIQLLKTIFVTKEELREELFELRTEMLNTFVTKQEFTRAMEEIRGEFKEMRRIMAGLVHLSNDHTYVLADHENRLIALEPPKSQI